MSSCLFLLSWSPTATGGVNQAVIGLSGALQRDTAVRPVIGVTSWGPIALPEQVSGVPVIRIPLHDGYEAGVVPTLKSLVRLPRDLAAITRIVRAQDITIVNVHFPTLGSLVWPVLRALRLYRGKLALTFHGADIRAIGELGTLQRTLWKALISSADVVLTCSAALAAEVRHISPDRKVTVIPNGADIPIFNRASQQRVKTEWFEILNIGKYEHKKGQDVLLAALRALLERGRNVRLTMVGARGPEFDSLQQVASTFGDRVRTVTDVPHDKIPEMMSRSSLFVLPSRAEGFPIVLIEAGAAGLPIVATKIPGVTEFLTDGSNALLVPADDSVALANAIDQMLLNAQLRETLATNIKAHAAGFTWSGYAAAFLGALAL